MNKFVLLLSSLFFVSTIIKAQDCKVLMKTINKSYSGDCKKGKANGQGTAKGIDSYRGEFKKGLPNGKGTYTWANGDVYEGDWVKGNKEGEGKLTYANDTVYIVGFWKKDKYIGMFKNPYKKIDKSPDVSALTIKRVKTDEHINSVRFYFKVDQQQIYNPQMTLSVHHGNHQDIKNRNAYVELTNVQFPIKLKGYYDGNYIEIEILEAGFWDVRTEITKIKGLQNY